MDRRSFFNKAAAAAAVGFTASTTLSERAEAIEHEMMKELDRTVVLPSLCKVGEKSKEGGGPGGSGGQRKPFMMGDDPRLPKMPAKPTLVDFFKLRFAPASHLLQSAALALKTGAPEKVVLASLLHDIGASYLIRTDHGYWGAQMIEPYVSEEISWAVRAHQALRFFPDESVGYSYPEAYIRYFGADYKPEPYIYEAAAAARKHKWYMTARLITMNDVYAFDPNAKVSLDPFIDIIGRHFKQPKEGLGFDNSPSAHMWRTIIWPNNFL
jgi:hypothetical protein